MRMQVQSLASLSGLRIRHCCELWYRLQTRLGSVLLWLWYRQAAAAPIQPLAWEPPCAVGAVLKSQKKKEKGLASVQNARANLKKKKKKKERSAYSHYNFCKSLSCISVCLGFASYITFLFIIIIIIVIIRSHPWHVEIPRPRIEPMPQQQPKPLQ